MAKGIAQVERGIGWRSGGERRHVSDAEVSREAPALAALLGVRDRALVDVEPDEVMAAGTELDDQPAAAASRLEQAPGGKGAVFPAGGFDEVRFQLRIG